jgi:hypothetical protein
LEIDVESERANRCNKLELDLQPLRAEKHVVEERQDVITRFKAYDEAISAEYRRARDEGKRVAKERID